MSLRIDNATSMETSSHCTRRQYRKSIVSYTHLKKKFSLKQGRHDEIPKMNSFNVSFHGLFR